jgi:Xaa-Pro aminopeptidase
MAAHHIDWIFVTHSTDLKYLINYTHRQSERMTLFLLPQEGRPTLLVPSFEMTVVEKYASFFDVEGWDETEDPVAHVASHVGGQGAGKTIAIGDQLYAVFLLRIQAALPAARWVQGGMILARLRMIKDSEEIASLRGAAHGADRSLQALLAQPLSGKTELDVIRFLHAQLLQNGHETIGTGIVGAGENGASPHHKTSTRTLEVGQAVVIDFGGGSKDYRSDITRTFHIGEPSAEFRRVYEIVQEAQQRAFEAVRPGVWAEDIDATARSYISQQGYGAYFLHRTGHGIGLDNHEPPYLVEGDVTVLEPGMMFSIEPGVYLKGQFGVRIEDIVMVTPTGAERLNEFPRDLTVVE